MEFPPSYETISGGTYKGARKMYVYIKKARVGQVPGLDKFVAEYVSDAAIGADGYLADKGLVPLPDAELAAVRGAMVSLAPMSGEGLK